MVPFELSLEVYWGYYHWKLLIDLLIHLHEARYSLRAKRIIRELHEQPFIVELDLRGIYC